MKKICSVLCLVITLSYGQKYNKSCECGVEGNNRRIVGGTTVQPHQYPWLVSLMLGPKLHCGGAIISDMHILTAGHCITFGVSYRDLTVYAGMHDRLDNSYATYRLTHGIKHPKFTSNAVRDINDIAVLTLDRKLKFTDKVRPICLPGTDMEFTDIPLTVAGWGKTRQGALTSSRYLLETKVKIVDGNKCRKSAIYKDNLVLDTMMCAYNLGKDACQGDSGGPLFSTHEQTNNRKWYQVGIVSWGIDCAMPDYPGKEGVVSNLETRALGDGNIVMKPMVVGYFFRARLSYRNTVAIYQPQVETTAKSLTKMIRQLSLRAFHFRSVVFNTSRTLNIRCLHRCVEVRTMDSAAVTGRNVLCLK